MSEVKLTTKQRWYLQEALRRYTRFNDLGKSLIEAWTGLEYASYAKPVTEAGLMVFIGKYAPRCLGWMRLTEKGAAIVQKWLDAGYTYVDVEEGKWLT